MAEKQELGFLVREVVSWCEEGAIYYWLADDGVWILWILD